MRYDPDRHHRRSIRLQGYDYAQAGAYFVTVNAEHRQCLFGEIVERQMHLNPIGEMVLQVWEAIPDHYPGVEIDAFVVMPNHIHGIIVLEGAAKLDDARDMDQLRLMDVVHRFKSLTTNRYINGVKTSSWPAFDKRIWQRNYHERIIRDEAELNAKREYVFNNPLSWDTDEENLNL